jgi:hypothetical protein
MNIQTQDNNDMNVENNGSPFSTPIRHKKRTSSSLTSASTPTTPCSQCAYLFHNPHELHELRDEIDSLKQNNRNLLENIEELKLINKQHQEREVSIAASITFIKQRPIHHNVNIRRYKHKSQLHKRKMCWKRRYTPCMHVHVCSCRVMLFMCACVCVLCVCVCLCATIQALSKSLVCGLD